ncbi:FAD-binding protein [Thermostaphylospora chromogena]|uniref:FAD/FMN-containing dehydrogenase n=1 Tax=Thermostaphylospora chromogena TaxID=35622 RepID=A0A1H1HA32_9ACTN|nr:FAD-binding protein [Thermostaphylospora chromogena]SDR22304.1 FAD/FMN-containing dehydrogenase [Thermostaphylospora chromogena]
MTDTISRRSLLKSTAVAVAGWSAVNATWVTAAEAATTPGMVPVPRLDGTLEFAPRLTGNFTTDFGKLVKSSPKAVLRPGSVQDIVKMVNYARRNRLKIAMNGQGGTGDDLESHSNYGQAGVSGGIAVDARSLSKIHRIDKSSAVVDAGVTWAALCEATLARGKVPPALTDYLHLSIGGTVSVGGIGGMTHRYGLQCDIVEEIEIVTGEGRVLTASPSVRPELFRAALAGGGQVGIITRLKVKLVPAPARVMIFSLYYDDLSTYLADQEKILSEGRFNYQAGEIVRKPDDSGWRYKIEVGAYFTPPSTPDQKALLADLRDDRAAMEVAEHDYREWIFRVDGFEAFLKENGYWEQAKPWLSLILPASQVKRFITTVVAELVPDDLGAGISLLSPFWRSKLTCPLFALPETRDKVLYLFDLLRFPHPGSSDIQRMLEQNRRFYDQAVALGGKRYLVGAIPNMTNQDWRRHFGRQWNFLAMSKLRFDPDNVLTPGQGFFA